MLQIATMFACFFLTIEQAVYWVGTLQVTQVRCKIDEYFPTKGTTLLYMGYLQRVKLSLLHLFN